MRILFTICGRAGSKGIKNKNLRMFCDKHLVYYTVSAIDLYKKQHPEFECDIAVNSDSEELLKLVVDNGMTAVDQIWRDECLAGDNIGKIAVVNNCLAVMEAQKNTHYDIVVDLDITSPLRTVEDIEKAIDLQIEKKADVVTTVAAARRNPYFNQVKRTEQGVKRVIESNYTARQQAPEIYDMNASIYAYDPEFLRTQKGVLDGYCEIVEMYDTGILDLDHENDFELMEIIAKHLFASHTKYQEIRDNIPE